MTATVAGGPAAHDYEGRGARGKGHHAVRGPSGGGGAGRARPSKKEMRAEAAEPPRDVPAPRPQGRSLSPQAGRLTSEACKQEGTAGPPRTTRFSPPNSYDTKQTLPFAVPG